MFLDGLNVSTMAVKIAKTMQGQAPFNLNSRQKHRSYALSLVLCDRRMTTICMITVHMRSISENRLSTGFWMKNWDWKSCVLKLFQIVLAQKQKLHIHLWLSQPVPGPKFHHNNTLIPSLLAGISLKWFFFLFLKRNGDTEIT